MNTKILTYDDVKNVPLGDNQEALVRADEYDSRIICEYKKFDMVPWTGFDILVRDTVARMLAKANASLLQRYGTRLKVVYGYRSVKVQRRYFEKRFNDLQAENPGMSNADLLRLTHNYVAVPDSAGHTLGAAVDVAMVNEKGEECDMGTDVADYSEPALIQTFAGVGKRQADRRRILLDAMMDAGFAPFLGEWWHFSYGDKEWAAYYKRRTALYGPVDIPYKAKIYTIAGGNKTVLQVADTWKGVVSNRKAGEALMACFPYAEQAGIYYKDRNRLEMAGGEFCGNAAAAVAALISGNNNGTFGVSGLEGSVSAQVRSTEVTSKTVTTKFRGIKYSVAEKDVDGASLPCVDFGGITHLLIEGDLPDNFADEAIKIREAAQLGQCDAVGVIWFRRLSSTTVKIDPVVWVRDINTLFYETSCGSGAMAAAIALGAEKIEQPTGDDIQVAISESAVETVADVSEVTRFGGL